MEIVWRNLTRGLRRTFSARSGFNIQKLDGFSLPEKDHLSERAPQQHGSTYVATFFRSRELALTVLVNGCDGRDFQAKHRSLIETINPLDDGELLIIGEDGTRYTLTCRPSAAVALRRYSIRQAEALIQLLADDPFFHTALRTQQYSATLSTGLLIPFSLPAVISSSTVESLFTVNNAGHVETWPTITVQGPVTSPTLENLTSGKSLLINVTVAAGDVLTVDMGQRSALVTSGGGAQTNVLGDVSGVFWSLLPGDNSLRVGATSILVFSGQISWLPNYLAVI